MKKLICIYTCEKDKKSLCNFKQTNLYKKLQSNKNTKILEVYAGANETKLNGDVLHLKCPEKYSKLSLKTFEMIKECIQNFEFDTLIKIDSNIFEYENTDYGFTKKIKHDLFNEKHITNVIFSEKINTDYYGTALSVIKSFKSFQTWANHKNIKLNCNENDLQYNVPFFAGKFYSCSRNFCEYISNNGESLSYVFADKLGGAEDVFIGNIYKQFTKGNINLIIDYLIQCDFENYTQETKRYLRNLLELYQVEYKKYELEKTNCLNNDYFDEVYFLKDCRMLFEKVKIIESII
jgi:hypothetical protein